MRELFSTASRRFRRRRSGLGLVGALLCAASIVGSGGSFPSQNVAQSYEGPSASPVDPGLLYEEGNISLGPPGANPGSEVVDSATGVLFVGFGSAFEGSGPSYVDMLSVQNRTLLKTIAIGPPGYYGPGGMAVDSTTGDVLVATALGEIAVISGATGNVTRYLSVGSSPDVIVFDPITTQIFIANFLSNMVMVLNGSDYANITSISIAFPVSLAFNPDLRQIDVVGQEGFTPGWYVAGINDTNLSVAWSVLPPQLYGQSGSKDLAYDHGNGNLYIPAGSPANDVLVMNASDGTTVETIPVGAAPSAVAYASKSNSLFVTDSGSDMVTAINATSSATRSIPVRGYPQAVAYSSLVNAVYVANYDTDSMTIIDGTNDTTAATVTLGLAPRALAFIPSVNMLYSAGGDSLQAILPSGGRAGVSVTVGQFPQAIAYDSATGNLYVTNADSGTVSVVTPASMRLVATLSVGGFPTGIAYDSVGHRILVALAGANALVVISDTNGSELSTVRVGGFPVGVVYDASRNLVFVANYDSDSVTVVSGLTFQVLSTISLPLGSAPAMPAFDPVNGEVFVPDRFTGNVSIVSDNSLEVVKNLSVGDNPFAGAYDPVTDLVYISDPVGNSLSVISPATNTLVSRLPVGGLPFGVTCNPQNGTVYVADSMSDTITYFVPVIQPTKSSPSPETLVALVLGPSIGLGSAATAFVRWRSRRKADPERAARSMAQGLHAGRTWPRLPGALSDRLTSWGPSI